MATSYKPVRITDSLSLAESFALDWETTRCQLNIWNSTNVIDTAIKLFDSKSHKRFGCHSRNRIDILANVVR